MSEEEPQNGRVGRRDDALGPVGQAIATARELLDLEIVCVSRLLGGPERRYREVDRPLTTLPENAVTMPLESPSGALYGSLVCVRPDGQPPLDERDEHFLRVIGRLIGGQIERDERELRRRRTRAEDAGMQALLAAIEARDRYTGEHSRGVVDLSKRLALELQLPPDEVEQVEQVALLHDVGKVAIPDDILLKPAPLDEDEMDVVKRHPGIGARIVGSVAGLAHLAPAIRSGHERWDGGGYPDGLRGEQIPLPSRITFVADAYDAMISERPYRAPLSPKAALDEVRRHAGTQFCPKASGALLKAMAKSPVPSRTGVGTLRF